MMHAQLAVGPLLNGETNERREYDNHQAGEPTAQAAQRAEQEACSARALHGELLAIDHACVVHGDGVRADADEARERRVDEQRGEPERHAHARLTA